MSRAPGTRGPRSKWSWGWGIEWGLDLLLYAHEATGDLSPVAFSLFRTRFPSTPPLARFDPPGEMRTAEAYEIRSLSRPRTRAYAKIPVFSRFHSLAHRLPYWSAKLLKLAGSPVETRRSITDEPEDRIDPTGI